MTVGPDGTPSAIVSSKPARLFIVLSGLFVTNALIPLLYIGCRVRRTYLGPATADRLHADAADPSAPRMGNR